MKFWLWLIFLGAGTAATYLILHDPGPQSRDALVEVKSNIAEENQQDGEDPLPPRLGSSSELILPADGGPLPPRKGPSAAGLPEEEEENVLHGEREAADGPDEEDLRERDVLLGALPERISPRRPTRRTFPTEAAGTPAPATPPALAAAPAAAPASQSGGSPASGPSSAPAANFATFPALPIASPPSGSNPAPAGRTSAAPPPQAQKPEKKVAALPPPINAAPKSAKTDAGPPRDELIKPISENAPETQKMNMTIEADPEEIWREAMKIPAGFAGLSLSPKSVAALPPPASDIAAINETQPAATPILGATIHSGFDLSEPVVFKILKDCGDPAQNPGCDPQLLPSGAPVLGDYFFNDKPHQDDLIPNTPDLFEIGAVAVGTEKDANGREVPQAEVAFHVLPGFAAGKYQVQLTGKNAKLAAPFEIVSAAPQVEAAATFRAPSPQTRPAVKSPPAPK